MSDHQSTHQHEHQSLDEILRELEERFGMGEEHTSSHHKKNVHGKIKQFTQNQLIGSLTLLLLVVGGAVGMFLGSQNQEIRQQAMTADECSQRYFEKDYVIYDTLQCTGFNTCSGNTQTIRFGNCFLDGAGNCVTSLYVANGTCDPNGPYGCQILDYYGGTAICDKGGGTGATSTPTRTPTQPISTNTPVPPTQPPGSTNTPIPPTQPPVTLTPSPTVPAPTCNGITMTYGLPSENRPVVLNDQVRFTCAQIVGAFRYEFRLFRNGVEIPNALSPTASGANTTNLYTIALSGNYSAQCRMCTGSATSTCQPWEQL